MAEDKEGHTHTIMSKTLAQALMESGVKHFAMGGIANLLGPGGLGLFSTADAPTMGTPLNFYDQTKGAGNLGERIGTNDLQRQSVYNNQANLANTLMAQSQGQGGPNVAQTELAQNTANNARMQGALMASQRGANANPALIARQAAMQGGAQQQQATGQAAQLRNQQMLGAQQGLQNLYGTMGQQVGQQQSTLQGAVAAQNASSINQQTGFANAQANTAMANAQGGNGLVGGILGGAAAGLTRGLLNKGGYVKRMAEGGIAHYDVANQNNIPLQSPGKGGGSGGLGNALGMMAGKYFGSSSGAPVDAGGGGASGSVGDTFSAYLNGGSVPGKAPVKGDSVKNDKIPALLSSGEIVLPRSVTMAEDAPERAAEFVKHLQSRKKGKGGFDDVAKARKMNCGGKV